MARVPGTPSGPSPLSPGQSPPKRKLEYCGLIMQGGITSGVVYPPAVFELSKFYKFKRIGGASAGAIAAAAAAAAELGRGSRNGGFKELQRLSHELAQGTNLRDLFQAPRHFRQLLELVFAFTRQENRTGIGAICSTVIASLYLGPWRRTPILSLVILQCLLIGMLVSMITENRTLTLMWVFTLTTLGVLRFAVEPFIGGCKICRSLVAIWRDPSNLFGLCPGTTQPGYGAALGMSEWLHNKLRKLAGGDLSGPPVTFGDLNKAGIDLELMTTDLCHQRPYKFPLDPEENIFLFKEQEMLSLFPADVVRWMITHGSQPRGGFARPYTPGGPQYYFLPDTADLPVAVIARLSMSFPILFCAVPLYTVDRAAQPQRGINPAPLPTVHLQRNWFCDGGIVSNFPIHLFDNWLPVHPVFGISLSDLPHDAIDGDGVKPANQTAPPGTGTDVSPDANRDVYLPRCGDNVVLDWRDVNTMSGLLGASFYTAKNHHDRLQSVLPSYRERIVTIRFRSNEGGLNLTMDPTVIQILQRKGRDAGRLLANQFNWREHRWARFRLVMLHLEKELIQVFDRYDSDDYRLWLMSRPARSNPTSHKPQPWREVSLARVDALRAFCGWLWSTSPSSRNQHELAHSLRIIVQRLARARGGPHPQITPHFSTGPDLPSPPTLKRVTPQ